MGKPTIIRDILSGSVGSFSEELRLKGFPVWQRWREIVGPQIASHARPYRIRNRVLLVRVDHPVWMQELQYLKEEIKEKLNTVLGGSRLENLFFLPGTFDSEGEGRSSPLRAVLTGEEEKRVERILDRVPNSEIKEGMRRLVEWFVLSQRHSPSRILSTSSVYNRADR
jgi:hypothetical protein